MTTTVQPGTTTPASNVQKMRQTQARQGCRQRDVASSSRHAHPVHRLDGPRTGDARQLVPPA